MYKKFNFGRWIKTQDNDEPFLKCPECGCGIVWEPYQMAIGTNGMHYCPYCGSDMWDGIQLTIDQL